MTHGSLFNGIGGFQLAAEWMGWDNIMSCEIDDYCTRLTKQHFPNCIQFGDIRNLTINNLWQEYVQNVKSMCAQASDHIVNPVIPKEWQNGDGTTMKGLKQIVKTGMQERNLKSLIITEENVRAVESLRWNFSQLTTRTIMGMQSEDCINHKLGNLLLNEDSQTITKYFATTAIMQELIMGFAHTIQKIKVDVITGGFPCQPFSTAGKRLGTEDNRYLWKEMLRAIREISPGWIVGENVRGLTNWNGGMVFDEVQADLEAENYEVLPFLLPACAVNAPHRRDRIWFVSRLITNSSSDGCGRPDESTKGCIDFRSGIPFDGIEAFHGSESFTDTNGQGLQEWFSRGFGSIQEQAGAFEGRESARTYSKNQWREFPTVSPIHRRDDGISYRLDRIKALGNAIVPAVAYQIFKAIEQYNQLP